MRSWIPSWNVWSAMPPLVKIHERGRDWTALEQDRNPFAVVVMAHLKAREVRDGAERKQWKLRLMRGLYERGFSRDEIVELFRFIDWLLVLPASLEQEFWHELRQFEEEKHMPHVTSVERRGFEQGLQEGLQAIREAILETLAMRLGAVPDDVTHAVQRLESPDTLRMLLQQAINCTTIETFRESLRTEH